MRKTKAKKPSSYPIMWGGGRVGTVKTQKTPTLYDVPFLF